MAVALGPSCSSFIFFENLQDWPELRLACSQHGNKSKSTPLYPDKTFPRAIDCHKLPNVLHELDFLRSNICVAELDNKVDKYGVVSKKEPMLGSDASGVETNSNHDIDLRLGGVESSSNDLNHFASNNTDSSAELQSTETQSEENVKAKRPKKKAKKKNTKIRVRSTKRWRNLDINEFGFHISRIPKMCVSNDVPECLSQNNGGDNIDGEMKELTNGCVASADSLPSSGNALNSVVQQSSTTYLTEGSLTKDSIMDDVSFFISLGVDVMADPDDTKSSKLPKKSRHKPHHSGSEHQIIHSYNEGHQQLEDMFYPPVNSTSYRKKCNKFRLYDLECSSPSKVYIRPDKHRRIEKAHKAVKSKNSKSLFNNQGRKMLYMHHRLVKMYNLDLYFRHSAKTQRVPAMTTRVIDVHVAAQVSRALAKGNGPHNDHAAPVQNLKHALHETNAPNHLDMDLASFLITLQHRDLTPEDYDMLLRLDDSVKPKTLSTNILSRLKTETIGPNGLECDDETLPMCTVCMEPYTAGQERKFLPCTHYFHSNCIDAWLNNSSMNCPLDGLPVETS